MQKHVLLTNDFPPKVGGIQSYLWELWRRLDPESFLVYTGADPTATEFDRSQAFQIVRDPRRILLPTPSLVRRARRTASRFGAEYFMIDPAFPLGLAAQPLGLTYGLVLHGSEVTVPARLPASRRLLARTLNGSRIVIAAGGYPADQARSSARADLAVEVIPPGVDTDRFTPLGPTARATTRARLGIRPDALVVVGVSRLVPRKGFDKIIAAVAALARDFPSLTLLIAGTGRDRKRLERLSESLESPTRFLGRVSDAELPSVYGCADICAMMCRSRWMGLEEEGFGIVFLEAAAAGVPQLCGLSGGSHEAVLDWVTGLVVPDPSNQDSVTHAMRSLLASEADRTSMADESRKRAVTEFSYDHLAQRLASTLDEAFRR